MQIQTLDDLWKKQSDEEIKARFHKLAKIANYEQDFTCGMLEAITQFRPHLFEEIVSEMEKEVSDHEKKHGPIQIK